MSENVGTSVASGAGTGATIGTSITPGIGTAIGAIIGGVASGVGAGIKNKKEKEARDREVKRLEGREDTAQQRSVADALRAGFDPRITGNINPSPSASVEPQQYENVGASVASGMSSIGSSFGEAAQNVQANKLENAKLNASILNQASNLYMTALGKAQSHLDTTDQQITILISNYAQYSNVSQSEMESVASGWQRTHETAEEQLQSVELTDEALNRLKSATSAEEVIKTLESQEYSVGMAVNGGISLKPHIGVDVSGSRRAKSSVEHDGKSANSREGTSQSVSRSKMDEETRHKISQLLASHYSKERVKGDASTAKKFADTSLDDFYTQLAELYAKRMRAQSRYDKLSGSPLDYVKSVFDFMDF